MEHMAYVKTLVDSNSTFFPSWNWEKVNFKKKQDFFGDNFVNLWLP